MGSWVERALAGEQIQIRRGDGVVELRPTKPVTAPEAEPLTPREALRRLQGETRLSAEQAARYLQAVREERLLAEDRRPA